LHGLREVRGSNQITPSQLSNHRSDLPEASHTLAAQVKLSHCGCHQAVSRTLGLCDCRPWTLLRLSNSLQDTLVWLSKTEGAQPL
jgi:hypothetical protein